MLRIFVLLAIAPLFVNAATAPRLEIDLNRDGLIHTGGHGHVPSDQTHPDSPFVFWVNADQDDLEESETWPVQRPDHSTEEIDSIKDLEDFHPVRIDLADVPDLSGATLQFTLTSDSDPALNLFPAADATCTNQHLVSLDTAAAQLELP